MNVADNLCKASEPRNNAHFMHVYGFHGVFIDSGSSNYRNMQVL